MSQGSGQRLLAIRLCAIEWCALSGGLVASLTRWRELGDRSRFCHANLLAARQDESDVYPLFVLNHWQVAHFNAPKFVRPPSFQQKCGGSPIIRVAQFIHECDFGFSYRARSCLREVRMFFAPIKVRPFPNRNRFTNRLDGVALREELANLLLHFRVEFCSHGVVSNSFKFFCAASMSARALHEQPQANCARVEE
jgi:hypothetical protein